MLSLNKTINFYGRSEGTETDEFGNKVIYATMDATIASNGTVHINKYTSDAEAYKEHAEEIEADMVEFEAQVHEYAQKELVTE